MNFKNNLLFQIYRNDGGCAMVWQNTADVDISTGFSQIHFSRVAPERFFKASRLFEVRCVSCGYQGIIEYFIKMLT